MLDAPAIGERAIQFLAIEHDVVLQSTGEQPVAQPRRAPAGVVPEISSIALEAAVVARFNDVGQPS